MCACFCFECQAAFELFRQITHMMMTMVNCLPHLTLLHNDTTCDDSITTNSNTKDTSIYSMLCWWLHVPVCPASDVIRWPVYTKKNRYRERYMNADLCLRLVVQTACSHQWCHIHGVMSCFMLFSGCSTQTHQNNAQPTHGWNQVYGWHRFSLVIFAQSIDE